MLSRAGIFRAAQGVAVDMTDRVYRLPSFNGIAQIYFYSKFQFLFNNFFYYFI